MACVYVGTGSGCIHIYSGYGIDCIYEEQYAGVSGNAFHLWSAGRMPVQLRGIGSGEEGDFSYDMAENHYTDTANIYFATHVTECGNGRISG